MLDPVLRVADVLFLNAAEAHALTGHPVLADAAGILARRGPLVVVTDGPSGPLAHDGSAVISTAALAVEPVDTVGAGDSFAAGYVAAVLKGFGRERALALAMESAG
jgi:sugar/nucleoside kinase (ribokinase family)